MANRRRSPGDPAGLLPTGTITFAFTDIEWRTPPAERDGAATQEAGRRQASILREAIELHGGCVFKTIGDGFCAAFTRPEDAVEAMVAAQRTLAAEDFSTVDGVRIRAALNTGIAEDREGDYFGPPLNKVARLLAIGHGGQILVTDETAALLKCAPPSGASLHELGTYHLKDIGEPQRVHQVLAPGLPNGFPPLRSLGVLPSDLSIVDTREIHSVSNFSGREDDLAAVHAALAHDAAIVVVHGLGGVGKTSIAREYGWHNRDRYSIVWWLNAQSEDGIMDGLLRLGAMFVHGLDQMKDRRAAANRVLHSVLGGFERPVLLVFDNLGDEQLMRAWLPRTGARALATSRDAAWGNDIVTIPLETWSLETATRYLHRSSGRADLGEDDARDIARTLGALPLALAHAAAALRNLRMVSARRYLERMREHLTRAPRGAEYPRSVFATFSTAIAQAEQHAAGAAALLFFAASFAPDAIPDELLRQAPDRYAAELRPMLPDGAALDLRSAVANERGLDEALHALDRLALLPFHAGARTYSMHRLVQLAAQDLAREAGAPLRECAITAAETAFPQQPGEITFWPACERLLPHARAALDALPADSAFLPAGQLAYRCSLYLHQRGQYALAAQTVKRALAIQEAILGPDDLGVARSLHLLGRVYWEQGLFAEAESLQTKVLAIREAALGSAHPDVADSLNMLAFTYRGQGRYAESERLLARALSILEAALGPDHPNVAVSLNSLAVIYYDFGRYADAQPLWERAVAVWEKAYGPDHRQVGFGLNNLAGVHRQRGHAKKAEPFSLRSVAIRETVLGPVHPELAMSLNVLARVYADQARFAEAEEQHLRALAIRENAFGPDRPDVAQSLNNLGDVYRLQGRLAEAEQLLSRAISIRQQTLGREHPELAMSLCILADVYRRQGRHEEAQTLLARALTIRANGFAQEHPDSAFFLNVLALEHADRGRLAEAEAAHLQALSIRENAFGREHPDVAESLNNLADVYRRDGRRKDAEPLLARALRICEDALGSDHPLTQKTRDALRTLRSDKTGDAGIDLTPDGVAVKPTKP